MAPGRASLDRRAIKVGASRVRQPGLFANLQAAWRLQGHSAMLPGPLPLPRIRLLLVVGSACLAALALVTRARRRRAPQPKPTAERWATRVRVERPALAARCATRPYSPHVREQGRKCGR
jgi:hypothetical protein